MEKYKDVQGYEDLYSVSSNGVIFDKEKQRVSPQSYNTKRYLQVNLKKNGAWLTKRVHRIMMEAFYPVDGMEKMSVNHINGKRDDNNLENLEWVSNRENASHSVARQKKGTSKYPGVSFSNAHQRYIAQVYHNKKNVYLGLHLDEIDAHKAVLAFHEKHGIENRYLQA